MGVNKYVREFLGFPDILIMGLLTVLVTAFAWLRGPAPQVLAATLVGVGLFFVSEYATHRFLFHMAPPRSAFLRKMIYRLHYHHHEEPNDLHLLFLPIWYSIPQFTVTGGLTWLVTGQIALGAAFASGSMLLLMYYEWCHYVAHRPITPLTAWGRWMKRYHLWHHFKNEHYWYGVTNPSFDLLMGTYKDVRHVEKSETVRKLDAKAQ